MTQIWLPYCKYQPHSHNAKWLYRTNIILHIYQNKDNCNTYFIHNCQIYVRNKYPSQMPHISYKSQLVFVQMSGPFFSIYTSYQLTAINIATRSLAIHTCPHFWHMPLNKYAFTYVHAIALILYSTCRPHITACTSKNINKLWLFFTML